MRHHGLALGMRIGEIRKELYGDRGVSAISEALGLPERAWENFERGVGMPATIVLLFLDLTGANPHWLLTGEGERFSVGPVPGGGKRILALRPSDADIRRAPILPGVRGARQVGPGRWEPLGATDVAKEGNPLADCGLRATGLVGWVREERSVVLIQPARRLKWR